MIRLDSTLFVIAHSTSTERTKCNTPHFNETELLVYSFEQNLRTSPSTFCALTQPFHRACYVVFVTNAGTFLIMLSDTMLSAKDIKGSQGSINRHSTMQGCTTKCTSPFVAGQLVYIELIKAFCRAASSDGKCCWWERWVRIKSVKLLWEHKT